MLTARSITASPPLTGEVRPEISLTTQTGAWTASGDAGGARLLQERRRGDGQCVHLCEAAATDWQMDRLSGGCRLNAFPPGDHAIKNHEFDSVDKPAALGESFVHFIQP